LVAGSGILKRHFNSNQIRNLNPHSNANANPDALVTARANLQNSLILCILAAAAAARPQLLSSLTLCFDDVS
jgi:hypothetical protein